MPNVSLGSVVEWKYKIVSPYYYNIEKAVFQYDIPVLYYKARIEIPTEITVSYEYRKFHNVKFNTKKGLEFSINNVKPLVHEPFVDNIENYRGKVIFEVKKINFSSTGTYGFTNRTSKDFSTTWQKVATSIYKDNRFGNQLKKTKYFKDDMLSLLNGLTSENEKINVIFEHVKNKVTWDGYYSYYTKNGVKNAYNSNVGNVADINLLLVAMLREAGLNVNPVLVSTRKHGIPFYPTLDGFNYVIAGVESSNGLILLDATEKYSEPNVLPLRVLNWKGRIIRKDGSSEFVDLYPKTYNNDVKNVNIKIDEFGEIKGTMRSISNNLNALNFRRRYINSSENDLISYAEKKYDNIEVEKIRVKFNKKNKTVVESIKFGTDNQVEEINDKLYFSPLFFLQIKENVFKSNERKYPIDFGMAWIDSYNFVIEIPESYKVEQIPESKIIQLKDRIGSFSYKIFCISV
jgi:hypothetical protein